MCNIENRVKPAYGAYFTSQNQIEEGLEYWRLLEERNLVGPAEQIADTLASLTSQEEQPFSGDIY